MLFFHGTTQEGFDKIQQEGFAPKNSVWGYSESDKTYFYNLNPHYTLGAAAKENVNSSLNNAHKAAIAQNSQSTNLQLIVVEIPDEVFFEHFNYEQGNIQKDFSNYVREPNEEIVPSAYHELKYAYAIDNTWLNNAIKNNEISMNTYTIENGYEPSNRYGYLKTEYLRLGKNPAKLNLSEDEIKETMNAKKMTYASAKRNRVIPKELKDLIQKEDKKEILDITKLETYKKVIDVELNGMKRIGETFERYFESRKEKQERFNTVADNVQNPKYHVSPITGKPELCKAFIQPCPYRGTNTHFTNIEDAQKRADEINEAKHGSLA